MRLSLLLTPLRSLPPSHPFLGYVTGVNLIPLSCPSSFKPSCPGITWAILWPCLQECHRACLHSPEGGKKPLLEEGLSSPERPSLHLLTITRICRGWLESSPRVRPLNTHVTLGRQLSACSTPPSPPYIILFIFLRFFKIYF